MLPETRNGIRILIHIVIILVISNVFSSFYYLIAICIIKQMIDISHLHTQKLLCNQNDCSEKRQEEKEKKKQQTFPAELNH